MEEEQQDQEWRPQSPEQEAHYKEDLQRQFNENFPHLRKEVYEADAAARSGDVKASVRSILDDQTLSAQQKEQKLKQLSVGYEGSVPGNLGVSKVPPAPEFGEQRTAAPDQSPLTAYFGDEEQQAQEIQQTADEEILYEGYKPEQQKFIRGASVSGGVDPETGKAVKPFMEPVDSVQSEAMHDMQLAYYNETGKWLYITSGKRTVEEQMKLHPGWSREKAERGQHVHGNAYDIFMAPPADGPSVTKGGKTWLSGHQSTDEYKWLAANAEKFGFVNTAPIHGPSGRKEYWHWEYTGEGGTSTYPEELTNEHLEKAGLEPSLVPIPGKKRPAFEGALATGEQVPLEELQKKVASGSIDSRKLGSDAASVLANLDQQFATNQYNLDQYPDALEHMDRVNQASNNLRNSTNLLYDDTAALQEQQLETAKTIGRNKVHLAEQELQMKQTAQSVNEQRRGLSETYRDLAFEEGQKRLKDIDADLAKLKSQSTSPWDMFGFYETNEETGKEEWSWGKTSFTFVSSMALLTNFAMTMGAATSKKGKQVPFLVFDMLKAAIDADTKGQVNSINKTLKGIEKSRAQYKDQYALFSNQAQFVEQARLDKIAGLKDALAVEKARTKVPEMKAALEQQEELWAVELRKAQQDRDRSIMDGEAKAANVAISALNQKEGEQSNLRSQILNGLINLSRQREKTTKLAPEKRKLLTTAQNLLPVIDEIEGIWNRAGESAGTKVFHKIIGGEWAKPFTDFKDVITPEGSKWWTSLDDIQKLHEIREQYAPMLAKAMGDTGNLAKEEQRRGMNQLPLYDSTELGYWKVLRFKQRAAMAASRAFHSLGEGERDTLRGLILAEDDSLEGIKKQIEIQERFLRAHGGESANMTMGYQPLGQVDESREYQIKQRMKNVRGVRGVNIPSGDVTITSKKQEERQKEKSLAGRTAGEELPDF